MAATPNLHPVILETAGLADYRLLDSGNGRKLERFGDMTLVRPEEQAIWSPRLDEAAWNEADAVFTGVIDEAFLETAGLADYRLLDSGNGRKLERFGEMTLVRPPSGGAPLTYGKTQVAGMRDFENPFFYAVGDESLLARMAGDEAA